MILGHEFVGEVRRGPQGSRFAVGRRGRVAAPGVSCGECERCLEGRTNLCQRYYTLGLNIAGGMAECVSVAREDAGAVPDAMSLDRAGLAQPMAVGLHAARRSGVRSGDRVVLIGAGAIGSFVLAGCARWRTSTSPSSTSRARAGPRRCASVRPASSPLVPTRRDGLRDAVDGAAIDVVIEASGAPGQLNNAIGMVRTGGTILQVGLPGRASRRWTCTRS